MAAPFRLSLQGGKPAGFREGQRAEPGSRFVHPAASTVGTGKFFGLLVRVRLDVPEAGKAIKHWLSVCKNASVTVVEIDDMVSASGAFAGDGELKPNEFGVLVDTGTGRSYDRNAKRYPAFYQVSGMPGDVMACMKHTAVAAHTPMTAAAPPRNAVGSGEATERGKRAERAAREATRLSRVDAIADAEARITFLEERGAAGTLSQPQAAELVELIQFVHAETLARDAERKPSPGTGRAREMRPSRALSDAESTARKAERDTIARIGATEYARRKAILEQ